MKFDFFENRLMDPNWIHLFTFILLVCLHGPPFPTVLPLVRKRHRWRADKWGNGLGRRRGPHCSQEFGFSGTTHCIWLGGVRLSLCLSDTQGHREAAGDTLSFDALPPSSLGGKSSSLCFLLICNNKIQERRKKYKETKNPTLVGTQQMEQMRMHCIWWLVNLNQNFLLFFPFYESKITNLLKNRFKNLNFSSDIQRRSSIWIYKEIFLHCHHASCDFFFMVLDLGYVWIDLIHGVRYRFNHILFFSLLFLFSCVCVCRGNGGGLSLYPAVFEAIPGSVLRSELWSCSKEPMGCLGIDQRH